jgi:hypothetical protein
MSFVQDQYRQIIRQKIVDGLALGTTIIEVRNWLLL